MRKITDDDVVTILTDSRKDALLAEFFGVKENTICRIRNASLISRIKNNIAWRHVS